MVRVLAGGALAVAPRPRYPPGEAALASARQGRAGALCPGRLRHRVRVPVRLERIRGHPPPRRFRSVEPPAGIGEAARIPRSRHQRAVSPLGDRDLRRGGPYRARRPVRRLPGRGGRGGEAGGAAAQAVAGAAQGRGVPLGEQGWYAGAGAPPARRPAGGVQCLLRRRRLDRPALPPPGRGGDAVRHHGGRAVHPGPDRDGARPRYPQTGARGRRPAGRLPERETRWVRLDDFRSLIERLLKEVPSSYLDGVVAVEVSPKTVPHPVRADIYTLGECVPLEWSGTGADLQSNVILYHGSFTALARLGPFDWRHEAWETLSHELRHHLEWRANVAALEAYDWAAEENFKRHEGQPFDPVFYRSGERVAEGVWKVEDDVFMEREGGRGNREQVDVVWHGRRYRLALPGRLRRPAFITLEGLDEPPPGDAVLVVPRRPSVLDLFRRRPVPVGHRVPV